DPGSHQNRQAQETHQKMPQDSTTAAWTSPHHNNPPCQTTSITATIPERLPRSLRIVITRHRCLRRNLGGAAYLCPVARLGKPLFYPLPTRGAGWRQEAGCAGEGIPESGLTMAGAEAASPAAARG
ncbi:MAG: hypothetical protein AB7I59_26610, partial [Geminicoccaceae bacterium]